MTSTTFVFYTAYLDFDTANVIFQALIRIFCRNMICEYSSTSLNGRCQQPEPEVDLRRHGAILDNRLDANAITHSSVVQFGWTLVAVGFLKAEIIISQPWIKISCRNLACKLFSPFLIVQCYQTLNHRLIYDGEMTSSLPLGWSDLIEFAWAMQYNMLLTIIRAIVGMSNNRIRRHQTASERNPGLC